MKILKNRILKISAVLLMMALLSVSLNLPELCGDSEYYSYGAVYAAEDAEIPTIGASEVTENTNTSSEDAQNSAEDDIHKKSSSTFFKWAIPISCVLSFVLAVFLAVRSANKRYGKEWE